MMVAARLEGRGHEGWGWLLLANQSKGKLGSVPLSPAWLSSGCVTRAQPRQGLPRRSL